MGPVWNFTIWLSNVSLIGPETKVYRFSKKTMLPSQGLHLVHLVVF